MVKIIKTTYLGPTDTLGARLKAEWLDRGDLHPTCPGQIVRGLDHSMERGAQREEMAAELAKLEERYFVGGGWLVPVGAEQVGSTVYHVFQSAGGGR